MNYCSIGKLVATFGVQGDLILKHHLGKKTALKGVETIFIEDKKDELLPYFVENIKIKSSDELYVKIEGISTKESAHKLVQKQVWLIEEEFHKHAGKSAPISLLGFHIVHDGDDIGEILEVIEQPQQLLCRIDWKGKEALIPIHEETLLQVDKKKKIVEVKLPAGLLDVFS
ncbi:MAG TPA: ribosome maturation factor RimM [Flavitalea sp.]|nr:ribosome maturation factor RimM [Flavitalea sp.]